MGSFGAIFVTMLLIFIISIGIVSLTNTNYQFGSDYDNNQTKWDDPEAVRTIILFNTNFSPLAGILGYGYYLHTCAPVFTRTAKS
jgi:hypothetical protein